MADLSDRLMYAADLELLYDALNLLTEAYNEGELDNPQRAVRIVQKFERFASIHEVRTNDLITLKEKVEKARTEYRSLKLRYDGLEQRFKQKDTLLQQVIDSKL
jgi:DNA-binding protein H-NS